MVWIHSYGDVYKRQNPELSKHVMYTSCEALEDGVEKACIALGLIK